MRTYEETLTVMRDYMTSSEIAEALDITPDDLVEALASYVELNFDEVERALVSAGFEE